MQEKLLSRGGCWPIPTVLGELSLHAGAEPKEEEQRGNIQIYVRHLSRISAIDLFAERKWKYRHLQMENSKEIYKLARPLSVLWGVINFLAISWPIARRASLPRSLPSLGWSWS